MNLKPRIFFLAAGQGSRLRPLTDHIPKCMVPYQGKPLIDHLLDLYSEYNFNDLVLIKGYCADVLQRPNTKEVINPQFEQTNMVATLFCADHLMNGPRQLLVIPI